MLQCNFKYRQGFALSDTFINRKLQRLWQRHLMSHINNFFSTIPAKLPQEVVEILIDTPNVTIERIISKGHSSPNSGWYEQARNEWVMVVQGSAELEFETRGTIALKQGDYITIPAREKHRVSWTDSACETLWLAVFY